jgi:peptidyl-prolyl cis-trans isomerase SurA
MSRILIALAVVVLSGLPGIAGQTLIDEIIVRVNEDIILKSEYELELAMADQSIAEALEGAEAAAARESARKNLLRDLIDSNLLRQKAEEYGVDVSLDVIRTMEELRQEYEFESIEQLDAAIVAQGDSPEDYRDMLRTQYMNQAVVNQEVYGRIIITTEEARAYYDANMEQFDRPAGIRLQEIVVLRGPEQANPEQANPEQANPEQANNDEARTRIDEALERVRDGEDFASVAAEVSDARTANAGGDIGFFENGQLSELYETTAAGLNRNQVSEVLELPDAYIVLRLVDRHAGGIMQFELALGEIQNYLITVQGESKVREYLSELREAAFIDIKDGYVDSGVIADDEPANDAAEDDVE